MKAQPPSPSPVEVTLNAADIAVHQTNAITRAESLWDPILQAQVLRLLGVEPVIEPRPSPGSSSWA